MSSRQDMPWRSMCLRPCGGRFCGIIARRFVGFARAYISDDVDELRCSITGLESHLKSTIALEN